MKEPGRDEPRRDRRLEPLRLPDDSRTARGLRNWMEIYGRKYRIDVRMRSAAVEIDLVDRSTGQKLRTFSGTNSAIAIGELTRSAPAEIEKSNDRR